MDRKSTRAARRAQRRRQKTMRTIFGGIAALVVLGAGVFATRRAVAPSVGEAVPIEPNAGAHVPIGEDPGPFSTNPPASGRHYDQPLPAGFYEPDDEAARQPYPEGYLLHNLEHGYVVFWYNCDLLDSPEACETLKGQIQKVMKRYQGVKLVAFPWPSLNVPVVMTTWGRMLRFDTFDEKSAGEFVATNRNRAPEPNAP